MWSLLVRVLVALVLVAAGAGKLRQTQVARIATVAAYRLTPPWLTSLVAAILPIFEIVLGLLLMFGVATNVIGLLTGLLLLGFALGIGLVLARGDRPDCGCIPGSASPVSTTLVVRDVIMAAACFSLLVFGPGLLAVDDPWIVRGLLAGAILALISSLVAWLASRIADGLESTRLD